MTSKGAARPLVLSEDERARMDRVDRLQIEGAAAIPSMIEMLGDPSWVVRRSVVAALGAGGPAAIQALAGVLRGARGDETVLAAAVDALVAATDDPSAELEALASDARAAVAADAAQILGRRRNPSSVPLLARLLAHADDNVAVAAIEALGRVGGRAAVDPLLQALASGNFFRMFPTIDVLGRGGDPRAVGPLAALLADPLYVSEAARALGRTGDRAATAPLADLLTKPSDVAVRVGAAALAELFERARERSGTSTPVEDALKAHVDPVAVARRLVQALAGADPAEQAAICRVLGAVGAEQSIPALSRLLDGAPVVAARAAEALKNLGSASSPHLLQALRDGDSRRRLAILPVVSRASALSDVVACLRDDDPAVRALACDSLARIGDARAARHVFDLLVDPNPRVVQAAIGAIQSLGGAETQRLALEATAHAAPSVRRSGLRILAYFGASSTVDVFLRALDDDDPRVRDAAIQGLPFLDAPAALEALFRTARAPDAKKRGAAMRALGQCASDRRVPAYLLAGLDDDDPWVRYYACQALGRLRVEAAANPIAKLLASDAGQVKVAAVEALAHLQSAIAFDALRGAARSEDVDVMRAALIGLGIARRDDGLPILLEAARATDPATRVVAVAALSEYDGQDVLDALSRAATDPDAALRTTALGFLGARPGAEPTRALVELLATTSPQEVVDALTVPVDGRVGAILAALDMCDDEIAPRLTSVLARMQRADAKAALFEALRSPNPAARKAAAATLAGLGERFALEAVQQVAQNDDDAEVRRVASLLLAQ